MAGAWADGAAMSTRTTFTAFGAHKNTLRPSPEDLDLVGDLAATRRTLELELGGV
jgi:hypothetical protein